MKISCASRTPLAEIVLRISDDVIAVKLLCELQSHDVLQQFAPCACLGNVSEVSCISPVSLLEDGLDQPMFPLLGKMAFCKEAVEQ